MSTVADELQKLHRLHLQMQEIEEKLEEGPRKLARLDRLIAKRQEEVETRQEELKQLRMTADRKGLELKTNEAKIENLRGKLNAATSNREYDAIRSQIDADTMANSVLEDEILESLEKVDRMQGRVREAEQDKEQAEQERQKAAELIEQSAPQLRAEAEQLQAEITAAEQVIPPLQREQYRRVVSAHGATALAAVEGGVCTSCYTRLQPQTQIEVRSGKFLFCKSCGRLLYHGN